MKKKAAKRKSRGPMIPPITVGFEEAVTRLLKIKPARRQKLTAKKAR